MRQNPILRAEGSVTMAFNAIRVLALEVCSIDGRPSAALSLWLCFPTHNANEALA